MHPDLKERSTHQLLVDNFMLRGGQDVPLEPTMPSDETLCLRAKLILEEALETVQALGVTVQLRSFSTKPYSLASTQAQKNDPNTLVPTIDSDTELHFYRDANIKPNITEIVDGCCDIKVVTTGTLSALGVPDTLVQHIVDHNNLSKFAPGWYKRDDGKIMKPPSFKPCTEDLRFVLRQMIDDFTIGKQQELGLYNETYTTDPYQATAARATRLSPSS